MSEKWTSKCMNENTRREGNGWKFCECNVGLIRLGCVVSTFSRKCSLLFLFSQERLLLEEGYGRNEWYVAKPC
jgi:hypothetical protein